MMTTRATTDEQLRARLRANFSEIADRHGYPVEFRARLMAAADRASMDNVHKCTKPQEANHE